MFRYIAFIVLISLHTNASAAPSWFGANPFSYAGSSDPSGGSSTGDLNFSGLKTSFIAPGINDTTSGGWVSTGIQAVSGQAMSFQKDLSKGISINPYVYLVEYRADYRFDYPTVFIYTCNTSGTSCTPDYASYSGLSSTTASSNTVSVLNNYFAMQNRGIPVYNGDLVNITYPNLTSSMTDIGTSSIGPPASTSTYINSLELNSRAGYYSDNAIFNMIADEFCKNAVGVSAVISSSCSLANGIYQYILSSSTSFNSNNVVGGITPLSSYSIPSCNSSTSTYYNFLYTVIQNISSSSFYFTNTLYLTSLNNLIRNYLLLGGKFADIRSSYTALTTKPSSISQTSYPYLYQLAKGSTSTDSTLQTAALSTTLTYCLQDQGLGLEIDVGTTIIKNENSPFISFATSGITNYVYSFTSQTDGLLGFRNTAKINTGSSYAFEGFDARLSTNTSSGVLNTAAYTLSKPKLNGFNFGRYLLEVRVGRGGNYLANVLPNLTYSYYIQPSGGSSPSSSTTGTAVPGFGQFAAPSSGTIWVKVASTDTNITGKAYMKVQSYTGSQVLSKGLNDYVIKPILTQFASVMRLIYDGPTGLINNSVLIKIVKTAAILYVVLFAIYFLFGQIRITVEELVSRIIKITLTVNILFSSQSWTFFNTYLFDTILRGTNYLILVFTGQDATSMTPFTFLDPIFNIYISPAFWGSILAQIVQIWNGLTFIAIITVMGIGVFLTCVFEVVMTYVLAFITIYILIGIAPLFIPLMLFSATSQFFYNWIKTLVKSMLVPVVFIVLILTFDTFIHQVLNSTIVSNHWGCLKQFSIHIPLGGKDLTFLENNSSFCLPFYVPNLTSAYNTSSQSLLNNLQTASTTDLQATAMSGAQSLGSSVSNNYVSSGGNTSGAWSGTAAGVGNSALAILDNTAAVITSNVSSLAGTALVGYMTVIRAAFLYFTYAIVAKQLLKVTEDIVGQITGIQANIFSTAVGQMKEAPQNTHQTLMRNVDTYKKAAGAVSQARQMAGQALSSALGGINKGIDDLKKSKSIGGRLLGNTLGAARGLAKLTVAAGKMALAKPSYDDDITQRAGRFVKGATNTVKATAWTAKTAVKAGVGAAKFALQATKKTALVVGDAAKLGFDAAAFIPKKITGAITKRALRDSFLRKYSGDNILKGMSEEERKKFDSMSDKEKSQYLKQEAAAYAKERWSNVSASRLLNPFKLADEKRFGKYKDQFQDLHTAAGRAKYNEARAAYAAEKGKERLSQVFSQKARDEKHFMQKYKGQFKDLHTVEGRAALKAEAAKYSAEKAQGRSVSSLLHGMTRGGKDEAVFLKANKANFKDLHTVEGRAVLRIAAKDAATMQMEKRAVTKYLEKFGNDKQSLLGDGFKTEALAYKQEQRQERSISSKLSKVFTQKGRLATAFEKENKSQFADLHTAEGRAVLRDSAKQHAANERAEKALGRYGKAFFEHNKGDLKEKLQSGDLKTRIEGRSELLKAAKESAAGIKQDRAAEFKKSPVAAMGSWITEKRLGQSYEKSRAELSKKYQNEYTQGLAKEMGQSKAAKALFEGKFNPKAQAEARLSKMSAAEVMKEALGDRVKADQAKTTARNQAIKAGALKGFALAASPLVAAGGAVGKVGKSAMERVVASNFKYARGELSKDLQNKIIEKYTKEVGHQQARKDFASGKFNPYTRAEAQLAEMSKGEIKKAAGKIIWSEKSAVINKSMAEKSAAVSRGASIAASAIGGAASRTAAVTGKGAVIVGGAVLAGGAWLGSKAAIGGEKLGSWALGKTVAAGSATIQGAVLANKFLDSALTVQVSTGLKLAGVLGGFALDSMAGTSANLTARQKQDTQDSRLKTFGGDLYDIFAKSAQSQMKLVPGMNSKIAAAAAISPLAGAYMLARANNVLPTTPQGKMTALSLVSPIAGLGYALGYGANKAYTNLTTKGPSSELSRSTPPNNSTKAFQIGGETYVLQSSKKSEPVLVKTSPDGSKGPAIMLKEGKNTLALGDQSVTINVSSKKDLLGRVSYSTGIEYKNPSYLKTPEVGVLSYGSKIGGMTMPNTINFGGQERSVLSAYGKRLEDGLMGRATLSHTNIAGKTSIITEHAFRKVLPDIHGAALDMKEKRQRRLAQGMLKEVAEAGGKFQERKAAEREAIDKLSPRAAAVAAKGKEFQERKAEERDKIFKLSPIAAAAAARGAQFTASSDRVQNALDQSKKAREESMKNALSARDNLLSDIRKGVELKKVGGDGRQASQERADFRIHKENMRGALADMPGAVLARKERLVQEAKAKEKFDKQVNEEIAKQKRREEHDKQVAQAAAKKEAARGEAATKLQALARGHLVRGGIRKEVASYIENTTTRSSQVASSIRAANEALKGLNRNTDGADAFRRELGIAAQGRDKQSLQELNQLTRDFGKARASFNELSGGQKDNALSALYRKDLHERGQVMLDATSKYQAAAEQLSNRAQSANEQRLGVFEKYVGSIEGTSKGLVDQIQKDRELQNKLQARYEVLTKSKVSQVDKDTKELTQKVGQLSRNLEEANNRFNALAADYRKTGQNQDKLIEAGREITKLKESYANDSALLTKQLENKAQEAAATKLQALARGRVVRANADKEARESIVSISARQNEIADFRKALALDTKTVSQNLSEGRNKQIAERNQEILGKLSAIEGQFKGDKDRFDALYGKQKGEALSAIEKVELGKLRERISQSDATYKSALEGLKEQSSNLQRLRKEDEYVNRITTSVANARGFKDETADIRKRITEERETLEIFKRGTTISLDLKTENWLKNLDKADADLKGARADITKLGELRKQRDLDEGERKSLIQAGLKAAAAEKIYKEAASQSKELNQVRARLQEEREGARRNFEIRTKANIASIDERAKRTENKAQELDSALRGLGRARGEGGAVVRTDETTNALKALNKEQANLHKAQQDFNRLSEAAKNRNLSKEERKQLSASLDKIDAASKASHKAFDNVHQESARVREDTKSALERAALAKQESFEKGLQAKQQADRGEAGQSIKSGIVETRATALQRSMTSDKLQQVSREGIKAQQVAKDKAESQAKADLEGHKKVFTPLAAAAAEGAQTRAAQAVARADAREAIRREISFEKFASDKQKADRTDAVSVGRLGGNRISALQGAMTGDKERKAERVEAAKQASFEKGLQAKQQADRREAGQSIQGGIVETRATALERSMSLDKLQQVSREGIKAQQVAKEKAELQTKADLALHKGKLAEAFGEVKTKRDAALDKAALDVHKGKLAEAFGEARTKRDAALDKAALDVHKGKLVDALGEAKTKRDAAAKQAEKETDAATKLQAIERGRQAREQVDVLRTRKDIDTTDKQITSALQFSQTLEKEAQQLRAGSTVGLRQETRDLITQVNKFNEDNQVRNVRYSELLEAKGSRSLNRDERKELTQIKSDIKEAKIWTGAAAEMLGNELKQMQEEARKASAQAKIVQEEAAKRSASTRPKGTDQAALDNMLSAYGVKKTQHVEDASSWFGLLGLGGPKQSTTLKSSPDSIPVRPGTPATGSRGGKEVPVYSLDLTKVRDEDTTKRAASVITRPDTPATGSRGGKEVPVMQFDLVKATAEYEAAQRSSLVRPDTPATVSRGGKEVPVIKFDLVKATEEYDAAQRSSLARPNTPAKGSRSDVSSAVPSAPADDSSGGGGGKSRGKQQAAPSELKTTEPTSPQGPKTLLVADNLKIAVRREVSRSDINARAAQSSETAVKGSAPSSDNQASARSPVLGRSASAIEDRSRPSLENRRANSLPEEKTADSERNSGQARPRLDSRESFEIMEIRERTSADRREIKNRAAGSTTNELIEQIREYKKQYDYVKKAMEKKHKSITGSTILLDAPRLASNAANSVEKGLNVNGFSGQTIANAEKLREHIERLLDAQDDIQRQAKLAGIKEIKIKKPKDSK